MVNEQFGNQEINPEEPEEHLGGEPAEDFSGPEMEIVEIKKEPEEGEKVEEVQKVQKVEEVQEVERVDEEKAKEARALLSRFLPPLKPLDLRTVFVLGFVFSIILVNFILIAPLFGKGFSQYFSSSEGAVISQAKFISDNFPNISWNPLWYLGFPSHLFSPPFLPWISAGLGSLLDSFSWAYRIIVAVFYILGPLSFYFLVRYITRKEFVALIAALSYNLPFLGALFFEETKSLLSASGFLPWRILSLAWLGEGPHIIALAFIPLALLFFLQTLRHPGFGRYLISGILLALVALIHIPGFVALNILMLIFLFSEMLQGQSLFKFGRALVVFLLGYGLAAFWYTPSFISRSLIFGAKESLILQNFIDLIPLAFVILPILGTLAFLIFERRPALQPLFLGLGWTMSFLVLVAGWYYFEKSYLPQPWSYLLELDMGLSFVLALAAAKLFETLRGKFGEIFPQRITARISFPLLLSFLGIFLWLPLIFWQSSHKLVSPIPNLEERGEFAMAQWFEKEKPEGRVFLSGSSSSWFNVFSGAAQVGGGQDFGSQNPWVIRAKKEIETGEDSSLALLWLKAFNSQYLAVPASGTVTFSGFKNLGRFEELEKAFENDKGVIYKIPVENPSLIKIVDLEEFEKLRPPKNVQDKEGLENYLNLIAETTEDQIKANFISPKEILLEGKVRDNQGILVQETFDYGWKVLPSLPEGGLTEEGGARVEKDILGFILVRPSFPGDFKIKLYHGQKPDEWLGLFITGLTISLIFLSRTGSLKKWLGSRLQVYKTRYTLTQPNIGASAMEIMMGTRRQNIREFTEKTKEFYKKAEPLSFVDITEGFQGIETLFHRNRQKVMLNLISKFGVGKRFLDTGCSDGLILRHLPPGSVGIDINPRYVAMAKKNAPQAAVVEGDIEEMPFPDESFSTVICAEVLEHLPNSRQALKEIKRVLQLQGILIGSVPHPSPLWKFRFLSKTSQKEEPFHREYTRAELEDLLSPHFEIITIDTALSYMLLVFVCRKID